MRWDFFQWFSFKINCISEDTYQISGHIISYKMCLFFFVKEWIFFEKMSLWFSSDKSYLQCSLQIHIFRGNTMLNPDLAHNTHSWPSLHCSVITDGANARQTHFRSFKMLIKQCHITELRLSFHTSYFHHVGSSSTKHYVQQSKWGLCDSAWSVCCFCASATALPMFRTV